MLITLVLLACRPDTPEGSTPVERDSVDTDTTPTDTATSTGDCGTGEVWDQDGCVPEACGRGSWGNLPPGNDAAWVDASAPEGGDGSRDFPLRVIADGLSTRKQFVYVAGGTYLENVVVGGGVELAGRCSEMVTIDASEDAVGIEVVGTADVHGYTVVRAGEVGIAVRDGGELTLADTLVDDSTGVGILVDGRDAKLSAFEVVVQGTDADSERGGGIGVSVQSGGVANLTSVLLDDNQQRGLYVRGFPSAAVLDKVTVRGTRPYGETNGYGYGHGISAEEGGIVTGSDATVDANTEAGIWVAGEGSAVTLTGVVVTGTLSSNRYGVGMGVAAYDLGVLDLSGSISGTAGPGVVAQSSGAVTLHDASLVQDSQFASVVVSDAAATLRGVTLDGVVAYETADLRLGAGAAVYVYGPTTPSALTLDEVTVTGVLEGVYLLGPGAFLIQNSILTGPNRGYGIVATLGVVPWNGSTGLRILADTVKNWQIGVLLDASSANISETTWFGNVFDVVQTQCSDTVPPVEGGGDLGVSALCTDVVWPVTTPDWIALE